MMHHHSELRHILRLIQHDLLSDCTLIVADSAIGELIPLYLQLPKRLVEMADDSLRLLGCASELDAVHMLYSLKSRNLPL